MEKKPDLDAFLGENKDTWEFEYDAGIYTRTVRKRGITACSNTLALSLSLFLGFVLAGSGGSSGSLKPIAWDGAGDARAKWR